MEIYHENLQGLQERQVRETREGKMIAAYYWIAAGLFATASAIFHHKNMFLAGMFIAICALLMLAGILNA